MSDEGQGMTSHAINPRIMLRARDLYATYCASSDGKNFQGNPCPAWDALPEAVRGHWYTVAKRTCSYEGFGTSVGEEERDEPGGNYVFSHLANPEHARNVWAVYVSAEAVPA